MIGDSDEATDCFPTRKNLCYMEIWWIWKHLGLNLDGTNQTLIELEGQFSEDNELFYMMMIFM